MPVSVSHTVANLLDSFIVRLKLGCGHVKAVYFTLSSLGSTVW